tara:strand:+ start:237 stop:2411 length:2175 start_codon:yes stop_codon:yes gene_type:complete
MALRLASPGISVREVDLTRGGVDFTLNVVGGLAAPFAKGPCNEITRINNEKELVDVFGLPGVGTTDYHYETWYAASHFLSYGGKLDIVRSVGGDLNTANAAVGMASTTLLLEGLEDYNNNQADDTNWYFAAKNPGHWAENIKVAIIDNIADQTITPTFESGTLASFAVGAGVTQALTGVTVGVGTTAAATGILKGIVAAKTSTSIDVRVTSTVIDGVETLVEYQQNSQFEFKTGTMLNIVNSSGTTVAKGSTITSVDWYTSQNILTSVADGGTDLTTLPWKAVLNKPRTNNYVTKRDGTNDALHVVVIDAGGGVTGDVGSILEKFANLSKAKDATVAGGKAVFYKDFLANNSEFIFSGHHVTSGTDAHHGTSPIASGYSSGFTAVTTNGGAWGQDAKNIKFSSIGNISYDLTGGLDYTGIGQYDAPLGDVLNSYDKFADPIDSDIRFLLQGGCSGTKEQEQAKANKLIQLAEGRKDTVAVISPNRDSVVNVTDSATQLKNVLSFFAPLTSSSYAVFDSGFQYVYDRFNKKFVYMPCSSDIAGCMVRTDRDHFPWFSPAGTQRGGLNFAIKLAFNPGQDARDQLYSNRINPITSKPGDGIILFGDKTALAFESAFDRINVRRLFIVIEQAIENAAKSVLFELNDAGTRSNFVNIVEPFLRDVQAKRGIQDFLLVCDETNNTPDVIDRNEFIADIFVKPARSINFIGLTFVATRTGVSFSEVVGTV